MVAGVAVIGAVAAIVALAVALRVARDEELAFEAAAQILEQRLDVRLARIEAQLAGLDARLQAWSTVSVDDAFAADETISSGWTGSTSMTWWSGINRWSYRPVPREPLTDFAPKARPIT
jgi:type II secretory pathway pseudopilin PulG